MLLVPHTLVGVAIASYIKNPALSLPLALLSHFAGDRFPHWDFFTTGSKPTRRIYLGIALDFLLGLGVGLFFTFRRLPDFNQAANIFWAAFFANLPDGLEVPLFFNKNWGWLDKLTAFQKWNQTRLKFPWGLLTQILAVVFCLLLLLN